MRVFEIACGWRGKTYVYLCTLFELNKPYAFTRFIIVLPGVPVREGVLKSIEVMKDHFRALYDNIPFNHVVYDSTKLNLVRETRNPASKAERREEENDKIVCAEKHFETIDVDYRVCTH